MKKALSILLAISFVVTVFSACSKKEIAYTFEKEIDATNHEIPIVTFNVAAPWGSLLNNTQSKKRVERFAKYMEAVDPYIICTQEMNQEWLDTIAPLMPNYTSYYVFRGGDEDENKSETNAIFWNKNELTAIDVNTIWLSETPKKESRYEGAGCNRICSYAVFETLDGYQFVVMNTHLDNASDEARAYGMSVIQKQIDLINKKHGTLPIIITGDLNDSYNSTAYKTMIDAGFVDSINVEGKDKITPKSTYTDWGKLDDTQEPIDFILTTGESLDYRVLDDTSNGYVSDHYGIYSNIKIAK